MPLIFDIVTATTSPSPFSNPHHILQLAWVVVDNDHNVVAEADFYIAPPAYVAPLPAFARGGHIHGITLQHLIDNGIPFKDATDALIYDMQRFDISTIVTYDMATKLPILLSHFMLDTYTHFDSMVEYVLGKCNPVCIKELAAAKYDIDVFGLGDLFAMLYNGAPALQEHDAASDAVHAAACFAGLRHRMTQTGRRLSLF